MPNAVQPDLLSAVASDDGTDQKKDNVSQDYIIDRPKSDKATKETKTGRTENGNAKGKRADGRYCVTSSVRKVAKIYFHCMIR